MKKVEWERKFTLNTACHWTKRPKQFRLSRPEEKGVWWRIIPAQQLYNTNKQEKKRITPGWQGCKCSAERMGCRDLSVARWRATGWRNSNFSCLPSTISRRTLQPKIYNTCRDSVTKVAINHYSQITLTCIWLRKTAARRTSNRVLLLNSSPRLSDFSNVQLRWSASFANKIWINKRRI